MTLRLGFAGTLGWLKAQGKFTPAISRSGAIWREQGIPLLANTGSEPLHPLNLIFEIFPYLRNSLDYLLLIRLFLLGLFTYLFAIELRLSPLAAAGTALTICFSGYVSRNINYILLNNDVWLPAVLLTAERMVEKRVTLVYFLLFSLFTALELIGGSPQSALFIFILIFLYVLIRAGSRNRRYRSWFWPFAWGFFSFPYSSPVSRNILGMLGPHMIPAFTPLIACLRVGSSASSFPGYMEMLMPTPQCASHPDT